VRASRARASRTTWPWLERSTAGRAARRAGSSSATRSSASSYRQTTRSPRPRVADADEAVALIAALDPADTVPYALAFYEGLRRAEIKRLEWPDVELDGYRLVVRKAKSRAGTGRRPPIAEPLRPILLAEVMRQGRREGGE
jgi:integrase